MQGEVAEITLKSFASKDLEFAGEFKIEIIITSYLCRYHSFKRAANIRLFCSRIINIDCDSLVIEF